MSISSMKSSLPPSNRKALTLCHSRLYLQLTTSFLRAMAWILIATKFTFASYSDSARVTKSNIRCMRPFWSFWQSLESSCNSMRREILQEGWISAMRYRSSTYQHHGSPMALGALGGLLSALCESPMRTVLESADIEVILELLYRDWRMSQGLCTRTGHRRGRPHGRRKESIPRSRTPCQAFMQTPEPG